jgi:hypothetical protein
MTLDHPLLTAAADAFRRLGSDPRLSASERNYWLGLAREAHGAVKAANVHAQPLVPTITFASPRPCQYVIGLGGDLRDYRCDLVGLAAAQTVFACADRPEVSRTSDWVLGDARQADNIMRRALRLTAAAWLDDCCPVLADQVRAIRVTRGQMLFTPRHDAPRIVTTH